MNDFNYFIHARDENLPAWKNNIIKSTLVFLLFIYFLSLFIFQSDVGFGIIEENTRVRVLKHYVLAPELMDLGMAFNYSASNPRRFFLVPMYLFLSPNR